MRSVEYVVQPVGGWASAGGENTGARSAGWQAGCLDGNWELLNWHEHERGLRSSMSAHECLGLVFAVHTVAGLSERGSCS